MKKKLRLASLCFIFIVGVSWAGCKIIGKIADTFRMRTGEEIYDTLFEKRKSNCVKILNYQDQIIPKIDYAIWLHFETCPQELGRILSKQEFDVGKLSTDNWNGLVPFGETLEWFNPTRLGDSIMIYEYSTINNRNIQTVWANLDSTEVFVRDILD